MASEENEAAIQANSDSAKTKNRKVKFPELDAALVDFVDNAESYLSGYGFGISWEVVRSEAFKIAANLNRRGIISDADYRKFKASNGYLSNLKKRFNLKLFKLTGEMNTMSISQYESLMGPF